MITTWKGRLRWPAGSYFVVTRFPHMIRTKFENGKDDYWKGAGSGSRLKISSPQIGSMNFLVNKWCLRGSINVHVVPLTKALSQKKNCDFNIFNLRGNLLKIKLESIFWFGEFVSCMFYGKKLIHFTLVHL